MANELDYGGRMRRAMQGLIAEVLREVGQNGLPGAHHLYITFDTNSAGVEMADWLRERYPGEMTIVIENWFADLKVTEDGFGITLNFGNAPERLEIPFDALRTFVDPSVEFGLRFEEQEDEDEDPLAEDAPAATVTPLLKSDNDRSVDPDEVPSGGAEVVSLDKFRK